MMHLLYCDETNLNSADHKFFVYGGISIPGATAKELHDRIEQIRTDACIPQDFRLKFNPKPDCLSHAEYIAVKQGIIEAAIQSGCTILLSVILHRVATTTNDARRNEINRVIYHYDCLLNRESSFGLCLIDRFSDNQIDAHLREKFSIGLRGMPYTDPMRLSRVIGFHYSAIGQSHFGSLIDVVIGSFRFAVNAHCTQDVGRLRTASVLLGLLEPMFIRDQSSGRVSQLSLNFSPRIVRIDRYRVLYTQLRDFLTREGLESSQDIRAQ